MSKKLIDEALVRFTDWSVYISHDKEWEHLLLHKKQKFDNIPLKIYIPLYAWDYNLVYKEMWQKSPEVFERSPYIRLCDRIGRMLVKQ